MLDSMNNDWLDHGHDTAGTGDWQRIGIGAPTHDAPVVPSPDLPTGTERTRRRRGRPLLLAAACATLGSERLDGHDLYVTLEPCPMCAAAISFARLARLYYGAADPKSGGVAQGARVFAHPQCHHAPEVYDGIAAEAAAALLRGFFADRR